MIGTSGEFSSTMTLSMPSADERREQVLDRLDRDRLARQPGRILNSAEMRDRRRNLEAAEVGPLEADAVVGRRRLQRQRDLVAGMKTDSGAGNLIDEVCAVRS